MNSKIASLISVEGKAVKVEGKNREKNYDEADEISFVSTVSQQMM
jgi:hypothetical protein